MYLSNKWRDLQEQIAASPRRPPKSADDGRKPRYKRFLGYRAVADIVARYEAGETTQQIASRHEISKTRVSTILREKGIVIRRQGLTTEQAREAATLYMAGKSLAWIGAHFGVSYTTVATELRKQGVQLRPRPGFG